MTYVVQLTCISLMSLVILSVALSNVDTMAQRAVDRLNIQLQEEMKR